MTTEPTNKLDSHLDYSIQTLPDNPDSPLDYSIQTLPDDPDSPLDYTIQTLNRIYGFEKIAVPDVPDSPLDYTIQTLNRIYGFEKKALDLPTKNFDLIEKNRYLVIKLQDIQVKPETAYRRTGRRVKPVKRLGI